MNFISGVEMLNEIKIVSKIIEKTVPNDVVILSHPDHDGLSATILFETYFIKHRGAKSRTVLHPTKEMPYHFIFHRLINERPKILLILDALIGKYKKSIMKLVEGGTIVINMDHHDLVDISHNNFFNLNPHKWQLDYLNTSSLAWQVLREIDRDYFDERAWLAGIGSVQDLCYYDNKFLFKTMNERGFSNILSYEDLFDSELMRCAKMINAASHNLGYDYVYSKILDASISNSIRTLLEDSRLISSYNTHIKELEELYDYFKKNHREYPDMNLIAYKHHERARTSLIAEICELDRKPSIYFGYYDGLLGFTSLFCNYDVRELGRLFNGGGPHPKIAGGRTKKSFNEVINLISEYFHPKQRSLGDFY